MPHTDVFYMSKSDMVNFMKTAKYWEKIDDGKIRCNLCPRFCVIAQGKTGYCSVRKNTGSELVTTAYGYPVALQIDPIEKKPLKHYKPGTKTFSLGTFGCNLGCVFCQNDSLSRGNYNPFAQYKRYEPEEIVDLALRHKCESIAFTYNEPTVWCEYAMDIAKLAREASLGTLAVTNGFISEEAMHDFYPLLDAANIDMKGFSDTFYSEMCSVPSIEPIKRSCEYFKNTVHGHLELTNLVIPGKNDSDEMIESYLDWVENKLGLDTVLHFSAYFPAHRFRSVPPTPRETLFKIRDRAIERGFNNIYLGNI